LDSVIANILQYVGILSHLPTHRKTTSGFIDDAKPLGAALYQSLNLVNAEDYKHRRSSIFRISTGCDDLTIRDKRLNLLDLVAREGIEHPTPAFSGLRSTGLTTPSINNLTRQDGRFIVTIL
jgi:hypothetical protein